MTTASSSRQHRSPMGHDPESHRRIGRDPAERRGVRTTCPRCQHANYRVRHPSWLWGLALAATSLFFVAMVLASSLIGPFIMFAVPIMAVVGFAFGPLHSLLTEGPTCAKCGRVLTVAPTARELARRGAPPASTRPALARAA